MTENNKVDLGSTGSGGVSRRTVTKAMAWAVPAIAIAAPIPAFAASGNPPTIRVGAAYKWPGASCDGVLPPGVVFADGNKAYVLTIEVTNNSGKPIYLYGATVTTDGPLFNVIGLSPALGTAIPGVPPGNVVTVLLFANSSNSGNLDFNGNVTVTWGHNYPPPDPDNHLPVGPIPFYVPCTPTPQSAGFPACDFPFLGGHPCQTAK